MFRATLFLFALLLVNLVACTKSEDSPSAQGSPSGSNLGQTIEAQHPAVSLSSSDLEGRIRDTFLVKVGKHCHSGIKKESVQGSAYLLYEATFSCGERPSYGDGRYVPISIDDFYSLIDLIQSDMKELKNRKDATAEHLQLVSALTQMFGEGKGKDLIEDKLAYEKDQQARQAMLSMLNMNITRHPWVNGKFGYDAVAWVEGASRDVLLAPAVTQVCEIQTGYRAWYGTSIWLVKSDEYTPSSEVARMAARLVFQSVGADTAFTPPGSNPSWSMTTPEDFLTLFFWHEKLSLFCPDKNGPVELDKMIAAIKSGEFARRWAALPTLSGSSFISLNGANPTVIEPKIGEVLGSTGIEFQSLPTPVGERTFGVSLILKIPHEMPSRALEIAADTAKITFDAAIEGMRIRDELTREIRERGSSRREFPGWVGVSFGSLLKDLKPLSASDFVDDVSLARNAFADKDKWLDRFVNYDTTAGASDKSFTDCRQTKALPHLIFDRHAPFDSFECQNGQPVWRMKK